MNFADVKEWRIPEGEVTKVVDSQGQVIWHKESIVDRDWFYVENISNKNEILSIAKNETLAPTLTIEYKTNDTDWTPFDNPTSTTALTKTLAPGEKVYLRCNTNTWFDTFYFNKIQGTSKIGGNIMSLLYGSNFTGRETSFPSGSTHNFYSLFYGDTKLVDASELLLPATLLRTSCYQNMFSECTSLTDAPVLPATTLAEYCYGYMFYNCTSLNNVTCLATSGINTNNSTTSWLYHVSSTGTFTKAAGATWPTGTSGIPSGWTVVNV